MVKKQKMELKFKKYNETSKPQVGDICLCKTENFCSEGYTVAEFKSKKVGFEFSGHGNIDEYVTEFIVIE